MGCTPARSAALVAAVLTVAAALPASAQVKEAPSRPGMLAPTAAPAAVADFRAAFDGYHAWKFTEAATNAEKAMIAAPSFGLARAIHGAMVGGPAAAAELDRGAADAAKGTAAEAVLALALREGEAGRLENARKLFDAAVALAPNEPGVGIERGFFLSGNARVDAFRELAKKFTDDAPSHMWLAYYLTERPIGISRADGTEALEAAQAAMRIAPDQTGSVTAMAHVLERLGRHPEAMTYLDRATEMKPTNEYAFLLKHEILLRDGKPAEARAAIQPAIDMTPNIARRVAYQRAQAMAFAYEGKPKEAIQALTESANAAESAGVKGVVVAMNHVYAAWVAGGMRDGETAQKEIAEARRLGASGFMADRWEVIALSLAGRPTLARQALAGAAKSITSTGLARENALRVLNGMILVAENKPNDAIPELKVAPDDFWAQLALVEAYRKAGKKAEANLAQKALFDRKDFDWTMTAVQVAHMRLK